MLSFCQLDRALKKLLSKVHSLNVWSNVLLNAGGQDIPALTYFPTLSDIRPGGDLMLAYVNNSRQANIVPGKQYYSVTFHALYNVSAPFEPSTGKMTIPEDIEDKGMIVVSPEVPTMTCICQGPTTWDKLCKCKIQSKMQEVAVCA